MSNVLESAIQEKRKEILARWLEHALALFTGQIVPGTPLFEVLDEAMGMILDGFDNGGELCREGINRFSRILAVHPFLPSRSMSMFFELQKILLEIVPSTTDKAVEEDLRARTNQLLLDSFDLFMKHREIIYQLKVEESSRSMHLALRRVNA